MFGASARRAVFGLGRARLLGGLAAALCAIGCSAPHGEADPGPVEILPPDGAQDTALSFDGKDDYASTGTAGFPFARFPQTVSFWLKAAAGGGTDQTVLILRKDSESGVRIGLCAGALCAKSVYSRDVFAQAPAPLPTGEWHHIAYEFDGSDMPAHHTIYLDGVATAMGTATPDKRTPTAGYLGSSDGTDQFFSGELDELRVWTVARTPALLAEEISGQAPEQEPPDLVAYYTFNEVSGARVVDHSGRGNHALLGDGLASRMPQRVPSGFADARP